MPSSYLSDLVGKNELPYLCFGGQDPAQSGIPFLPGDFSYLIKIGRNVGPVEIYPWLAELMFHSSCIDLPSLLAEEESDNVLSRQKHEPINVISLSVDIGMQDVAEFMVPMDRIDWDQDPGKRDYVSNYLRSAIRSGAYSRDVKLGDIQQLSSSDRPQLNDMSLAPRFYALDTMGQFGDRASEKLAPSPSDQAMYARTQLIGSGNPMRLIQRITEIGYAESIHDAASRVGSDWPLLEMGKMNCLVLNSFTNLARSISFREAVEIVQAITERAVLKTGTPPSHTDQADIIFDLPTSFFTVLNEGVLADDQIRFVESLFDAIITFDAETDDTGQGSVDPEIFYEIERMPLIEDALYARNKSGVDASKYLPIFSPVYFRRHWMRPLAGVRPKIYIRNN
ncbi:MAG: hypothetical protein MRY59_05745 [Aquisalinus sp.]|nr:hypothetical protein [Aquisalinus sp.]